MRAIVQRVSQASVTVDARVVSSIGAGLVVLLGVRQGDDLDDADRMARKLVALRIFEDDRGKMNRSVTDVGGEILCISQFTLYGDARRGNRPSFVDAAAPAIAEPLYERVCDVMRAERGAFGARMQVALVNEGPVTLIVET